MLNFETYKIRVCFHLDLHVSVKSFLFCLQQANFRVGKESLGDKFSDCDEEGSSPNSSGFDLGTPILYDSQKKLVEILPAVLLNLTPWKSHSTFKGQLKGGLKGVRMCPYFIYGMVTQHNVKHFREVF